MKHDFIDKYSNLNSVIHQLDPRVKLLLSFSFLILIAATDNIKLPGLYLGVLVVLLVISKVPFYFYFKKLLLITPLVVTILSKLVYTYIFIFIVRLLWNI